LTIAARRARLLAALGFLEIRWRGYKPEAAAALERWLHSWPGFGDVIVGMHAQGFDVELRQRGDRWRADVLPDRARALNRAWDRGGQHALARRATRCVGDAQRSAARGMRTTRRRNFSIPQVMTYARKLVALDPPETGPGAFVRLVPESPSRRAKGGS
jgi:hypothetical protein